MKAGLNQKPPSCTSKSTMANAKTSSEAVSEIEGGKSEPLADGRNGDKLLKSSLSLKKT